MKKERYVKCECGNAVRYQGHINKAGKCPRCGKWLREGEPINRREWLEAHGIVFQKRGNKTLSGDIYVSKN